MHGRSFYLLYILWIERGERAVFKEIFEKTAALNTILDKYDEEKESFWQEYCELVNKYFTDVNMLF